MAAVLLTMPGWLAVGYPVAVLVALNAGGQHRLGICPRVADEILRLAAFAAHLVELPPLLNVIRRQMSLVGQRPRATALRLTEVMRETSCLTPARIRLGHAYPWSFRH
jgi:hypothetical protein